MASNGKEVGTRDHDVPWYTENVESINDEARELLEKYSQIPADKVNAHVLEVRERAWNIWPYPCIGRLRFLDLSLPHISLYPSILQRLRSGQTLLDLGCCFGQELRKLVYDGAPSENLYGTDLQADFLQYGYELFQDKKTLKSTFIAADIFDESSPLTSIEGEIDIVYAGSFFHLFDLEQQVLVAKRVIQFLKPQGDALIVGRQVGYEQPVFSVSNPKLRTYRHNPASLEAMWSEIGEATGTRWNIEASLEDFPLTGTTAWVERDAKILKYVIQRH